jgi:hypothetical protein
MSFVSATGWSFSERVTFKCLQCHAQESYRIGVGGSLIPGRPSVSTPSGPALNAQLGDAAAAALAASLDQPATSGSDLPKLDAQVDPGERAN